MAAEALEVGQQPSPEAETPALARVVSELGLTGLMAIVDGEVIIQEPEWQERALCAQTDPEAFFPEKGGSTREAKKVCLGCDVRGECLDYALQNDEHFGIWGGLSERERRKLKSKTPPDAPKTESNNQEVDSSDQNEIAQVYNRAGILSQSSVVTTDPEYIGLPLTPVRSKPGPRQTFIRIDTVKKPRREYAKPQTVADPIADATYFPTEQEYAEMTDQSEPVVQDEVRSAHEVAISPTEKVFTPKRIKWLYGSINKAAQTPLLELQTSPEGELIVDDDEVNRLLEAIAIFAHSKKAGTNQSRRLEAYLRGQSLRHIAEGEGASIFTTRGFQQRVGRVLAEILTEHPEALTEEFGADAPECPRFLQPLLGKLSARQVLVMSTRFGDDGEMLTSVPGAAETLGMTAHQVYTTEKYIWKNFPDYKPEQAPGRVNYTEDFAIAGMVLKLTRRRHQIISHLYNPDGTQNMSVSEVAELLNVPDAWILKVQRQELGELDDASDSTAKFHIADMIFELSPRNAEIMEHLYNADGTQKMSLNEAARVLGLSTARVAEVRSEVLGGMRGKAGTEQSESGSDEPVEREVASSIQDESTTLSPDSPEHLEVFLQSNNSLAQPEVGAILESIRQKYVARRDNPELTEADESMLWPNDDQRIFLQILGNLSQNISPQSPAVLVNKYKKRLDYDPQYQEMDEQQKATELVAYHERINSAFTRYLHWLNNPHETKAV